MTEAYHYTACGLDYVYVQNGSVVRETTHGRAFAVEDARGLHDVLARSIASGPMRLRGHEVRFLRAQLKLSQDGLAQPLRTQRAFVAWGPCHFTPREPSPPSTAPAPRAETDFYGDPDGTRTHDTLIKSQVLYRLSYGIAGRTVIGLVQRQI